MSNPNNNADAERNMRFTTILLSEPEEVGDVQTKPEPFLYLLSIRTLIDRKQYDPLDAVRLLQQERRGTRHQDMPAGVRHDGAAVTGPAGDLTHRLDEEPQVGFRVIET
jgi:hypothetical protein